MAAADAVDVHQHLWPEQLVDRLRARTRAPYLRGWTLHTRRRAALRGRPGAPRRGAADRGGPRGRGRAGLRVSSPPRSASRALVRPEAGDAARRPGTTGARALPEHFRGLGLGADGRPGPRRARRACSTAGFVGVQLPATDLLSPAAWERAATCSRVAERGRQAGVRAPGPGGRPAAAGACPAWWAPVVGYVAPAAGRLVGLARRSAAARCSPACGCFRRRRRAGTGAPRAARRPRRSSRRRSTPTCSSTPRRTGRRRSTPGPRARASTRSCSAATGPTPSRCSRLLGDAATQAIRVDNPRARSGSPAPGTAHRPDERGTDMAPSQ